MAHVTQKKTQAVGQLRTLIDEHPIIAVVDMENLPARNLASMRTKLRGKVHISMTKKRLIRRALVTSAKPGVSALADRLQGMPALLFTRESPFTLCKTLKKNQSKAAIKPGQVAPQDLSVQAGPTSFAPGPIIGELGQLGIKAGIDQGKVVIKQDAVLARQGTVVSEKVAAFLARMGMEPMRIGLKLVAAYENGEILEGSVLDIDEDRFLSELTACARAAESLAVSIGYITKENVGRLLAKAHYDAAGLALEAALLTDTNARHILAKAYCEALGVAKYLPDDMRPAPPAAAETAPLAQHKEEKKTEEDAAVGLGALSG